MNIIHKIKRATRYKAALVAIFTASLMLGNNAAFAKNDLISVGPEVGTQAPEISVINTQESPVNIKQLNGDKGLIILFFRSADWCPFCKRHLIEMNDYAQKLADLGYGLAAISYDNSKILKAFSEEKSIEYPLLSDQSVNTMKAYGIVNTQYQPGDDNYGIPYPGVVILDKSGKVTDKYFFEGYRNRVKFDALYQQLKNKR